MNSSKTIKKNDSKLKFIQKFITRYIKILHNHLKEDGISILAFTIFGIVTGIASYNSYINSLFEEYNDSICNLSKDNLKGLSFFYCHKILNFITPAEILIYTLNILILFGSIVCLTLAISAIVNTLYQSGKSTIDIFKNDYPNIVGKIKNIKEIKKIERLKEKDLIRVCLIGISNVGKTSCMYKLADIEEKDSIITVGSQGTIININSNNDFYWILDAEGIKLDDQEEQINNIFFSQEGIKSSIMLIFLDHSESEVDNKINGKRLEYHSKSLSKLKNYLINQITTNNLNKFTHIYFLLNKSDLWKYSNKYRSSVPGIKDLSNFLSNVFSENKTIKIKEFEDWGNIIKEDWKNSNLTEEIELLIHSNNNSNDIIRLKKLLKEAVYSYN